MSRILKRSAASMVAAARERVRELSTAEAIALHGAPEVVFVDLRDPRERERSGFIPGSFHCPRGMLEFWVDPASPYHRAVFDREEATYLFHCASGWRSALAVATLEDMGFVGAAHLAEGFGGWVEAGGPVERGAPRD